MPTTQDLISSAAAYDRLAAETAPAMRGDGFLDAAERRRSAFDALVLSAGHLPAQQAIAILTLVEAYATGVEESATGDASDLAGEAQRLIEDAASKLRLALALLGRRTEAA